MPLGHAAWRFLLGIAPVVLLSVVTGCNAMPPSARMVPRSSDIRTRTHLDRGPITGPETVTESAEASAGPAKMALDTLDEVSPLPPALKRPVKPFELPPSLPTVAASADPLKGETPLLDDALVRAEARNVAIIDEVGKSAEPGSARPIPTFLPPAEAARRESDPKIEAGPASLPSPTPVKLSPAPEMKPTPTVAEPPKSEDVWRDGVQALRTVARDRLKLPKEESKPGSPNWAVRERLLGWLAEPDIDPDPRTAADLAQGRAVLKGLAAVLDPGGPATTRATEIREAVATLEANAPLEIAELKLTRMVHGFGNIEPLEPASRKAGQAVVLYCELTGLAYEPAGPSFRSRVSAEVTLIAEGSEAPAWSHTLGTAEDACRRRRRDFFIGHRFTLPESLAPGNYRIRLTEKDLIADHVATRETTITVTK